MLLRLLNPTHATMRRVRIMVAVLPLLLPLSMWQGYRLGLATGAVNLFAYYAFFTVFIVWTLLDYVVGRDTSNPESMDSPASRSDAVTPASISTPRRVWFRLLPLVCVPLHLGLLAWALWVLVDAPFGILGQIGWVLSMGTVSGILAINVAHELIHKPSRIEQWGGGLLLASVAYGTFKVEHVLGHHTWVATDRDPSSAARGQSVYAFVPRAIARNVQSAFDIQRARLQRQGLSTWSLRNELLVWSAISALLLAGAFAVAGLKGALFLVGQAIVAIVLLEIINYIEHYGLRRAQRDDGRFVAVTPMHSWNSSYFLSNAYLFQLQRHSDHHANAGRPYQDLRHFDDSPQLPGGYGAMILLALVPPLWRRVIHPRIPVSAGSAASAA
jgi:alkane 1-monooxygenase